LNSREPLTGAVMSRSVKAESERRSNDIAQNVHNLYGTFQYTPKFVAAH